MAHDSDLIEPTPGNTRVCEHRKSVRRRVFKGATILSGSMTRSCIVKNLSEGGAKLVLDTTLEISDRFTLRVSDGKKHECVVRWRTFHELGVQFLDE